MGMPDDYCELHAHTNFSFLDGATHPEELIARAAQLALPALAITDHAGLYAAVRAWKAAGETETDAAREAGLQPVRPIIGLEITIPRTDDAEITVIRTTYGIVEDAAATQKNLSRRAGCGRSRGIADGVADGRGVTRYGLGSGEIGRKDRSSA